MELESIRIKATQFCESYAAAVSLCQRKPQATLDDLAKGIFSHYAEDFVTFTPWGNTSSQENKIDVALIKQHMAKFPKYRLGLDIRQPKHRVDVLSPSHALCWITWSVHPPADSKIEQFEYEIVYSFRLPMGQEKGFWDFAISDNEIRVLAEKVPGFFDDMS